jgi:hypothetical protein
MSLYQVQKFLYQFNGDPGLRASYAEDPAHAVEGRQLTDAERTALVQKDFQALYAMGVHGLLLTPLANYTGVPIPQYLATIRGQAEGAAAHG